MKRTVLLAAVAVAVAVVGTAVAAFPQDSVKLYTGCLTSGGTIVSVKEGDKPTQTCNSPGQTVKLSGGDITSLTVTAPLTGGGDNGAVTIGLDASATLPSCSTGNAVPKWNATTGKWTCGTDNDTHYAAGTGLALDGGTFSLDPSYRVPVDQSCDSGKFATGIDGNGDVTCGTPTTGGVHAYSTTVGSTILAGETTVISKQLPPGTYVLLASVALANQDGGSSDEFSQGSCTLPGFGTGTQVVFYPAAIVSGTPNQLIGNTESVSLSSTINHPGGAVALKCTEEEPDIDVHQATLTAIRVDSLN